MHADTLACASCLYWGKRLMYRSVLIGLLVVACQLSGLPPANADERDLSATAKQVTQIIAHRGASAERPECTMSAIERAIEVGATAVEVDVRTSRDGKLFILHDATLERTTSGSGPASDLTLQHLRRLDAGSFFDPAYRNERIPSLVEVATHCRGKIDLLLDLKEQGDEYDAHVIAVIGQHGDPTRTIVGVRSVDQAKTFRRLLPKARQLALIPTVDQIEAFAEAGSETIRLWPRWLTDDDEPVQRVRAAGKELHLNGTLGEPAETRALLQFAPDSLSSDHPARLIATLKQTRGGRAKSGKALAAGDEEETAASALRLTKRCSNPSLRRPAGDPRGLTAGGSHARKNPPADKPAGG